MHDQLKSSQKQLSNLTNSTVCTLRASYKVALRIAKAKKPFTLGEMLVMGCIKDVCEEMLGKVAAEKVSQIPLSNDTIVCHIHNLAEDLENQLITQIKSSKYFSLQLDESTDIANKAI